MPECCAHDKRVFIHQMKCPECGAEMFLRETKKFKTKDGRPRKFYGCERFPECKGTHGAHPNGEPLGTPANQETKEWRHRAHIIFHATFNDLTRKNRYKKLQLLMGLAKEDAHIAKFDIKRCKQLIRLLSEQGKI